MISIFLVEDEIVVRERLRKNIKWDEYGIIFAGEAADGELAYPIIQRTQPDIIITDIRMPFMDGLQLSELVKKEMPWIKIIIVSGHDDFEYARKAISLGVTDYLLKPVNSGKIMETVLRVKGDIEREREQKEFFKKFENEMAEYKRLEHKQFFKALVDRQMSVPYVLEKAFKLGLELGATEYNIILFQISYDNDASDSYKASLIEMQNKLEKSLSIYPQFILFERDLEGFAVLVKGNTKETVEHSTQRCSDILKELTSCDPKLSCFIAVGSPVQRLNALSGTFEEARRAFMYRYILGPNEVLHASKLKSRVVISEEGFSFENFDPAKFDKKTIERFLKLASIDEPETFVTDYFDSFGNEQINSLLFRQYIAMDTVFAVISFVAELGADRQKFALQYLSQQILTESLNNVTSTKEFLIKVITQALRIRDASASKKYGALLEKAKLFISDNFGSEDISLNQVAAAVNMSPSHFSTVFSQETGSTFIEYLTNLRMDKAMELLRCSNMRTSEIAFAIGYRDPHYFSYLFKKRLGLTTKEYKRGEGNGEKKEN